MMTALLLTLSTTQLLTVVGLGYILLRLRGSRVAGEWSDPDSALIGTVEESLLELEDRIAQASNELGRQREEIEALLREVGTHPEAPPSSRMAAFRRGRPVAFTDRSDCGAIAERGEQAAQLQGAGYPERDIGRELRATFVAMELTLARLHQQQATLTGAIAHLQSLQH